MNLFKLIFPPFIYNLSKRCFLYFSPNYYNIRIIKQLSSNVIFRNENHFFTEDYLKSISNYAEIGSGQSTVFVYRYGIKNIRSVDSDINWINRVRELCEDTKRINITHVDFGPLGKYGRPLNYSKINNLSKYSNSIFDNYNPDLILIDGRFRVYCFLNALLKSEIGTKIIFDDYNNRPHYHVVESIIEVNETRGRQALFIKTKVNKDKLIKLMNKFEFVMD